MIIHFRRWRHCWLLIMVYKSIHHHTSKLFQIFVSRRKGSIKAHLHKSNRLEICKKNFKLQALINLTWNCFQPASEWIKFFCYNNYDCIKNNNCTIKRSWFASSFNKFINLVASCNVSLAFIPQTRKICKLEEF